jgi:replicative DNA helicase
MDTQRTSRPALAAVDDDGAGTTNYRSAPNNIEVEQALLGAILVNNDAAAKVSSFLVAENFYDPIHARIFEAATKLIERGQIATPITMKTYFENDQAMEDVRGIGYLADLAASAVTVINAEKYGRAIHDLAIRRELIQVGEGIVNVAYDSPVEADAVKQIEEAEGQLFNLAQKGEHEGGFKGFSSSLGVAVSMIEAAYKSDGHLSGVTTGLRDLDERLGGMHDSDLIILAGRPSMGKTALATNIAVNAAKSMAKDRPAVVGFFSLEMSADQLATRILSEAARVPSEDLRRGRLDNEQFLQIVSASQEIESLNLFIDDTPALSIAALRTRARRLKRQPAGLDMVVVDYLQLLRPSGQGRSDGRVQEVTEITQGLKALAKELEIPVLALSQLSRQVEQRDDKRPQLADLRESGSIEQDADVVMFIFREEYYHERRAPTEGTPEYMEWQERGEQLRGLAEVIIGKQRHGPTGTVRLYFDRELVRFGNYAPDNRMPDDAF